MKKMTKRIALALSMVLFALAFTACGPNLLSGGDGGSKDTEGGIGDTLSNMFFDYTVLEATSSGATSAATTMITPSRWMRSTTR